MFFRHGMTLRFPTLAAIVALTFLAGCEIDGPPELPAPTPPPATGEFEETEEVVALDTEPAPTPEPAVEEATPTPTPEPVNPNVGTLPYGIPVPGKPGFVVSPHSRNDGYVDVRGFPPGSEVKDPYSGQTFLVP